MSPAHIRRRDTASGPRYQVRYRLGGRGYPLLHAGTFRTMREARDRRDLIAGELANGRDPRVLLNALRDRTPPRTYATVARAFVASRHDIGASQHRNYGYALDLLLPRFGDRAPESITVTECRVLAGELAEKYAPSTVQNYYGVHAMILDFADVEPNPARHRTVKLPRPNRPEPTPVTLAELRAMLDVLTPRRHVLPIRLLEATGMRVGELAALTWADVDTHGGRFRVSRTRTKRGTGGQRFVQVPGPLMDEVDALVPMEDRTPTRRVFPGATPAAVTNAMARACRTAGLPVFSAHDLRHRRASLWHGQGLSTKELQARVGHSDVMTTLRTYSHVIDPRDDEWRDE